MTIDCGGTLPSARYDTDSSSDVPSRHASTWPLELMSTTLSISCMSANLGLSTTSPVASRFREEPKATPLALEGTRADSI